MFYDHRVGPGFAMHVIIHSDILVIQYLMHKERQAENNPKVTFLTCLGMKKGIGKPWSVASFRAEAAGTEQLMSKL